MAVETSLTSVDLNAYIHVGKINRAPRFLKFTVGGATAMLFTSGRMIVTGIAHPNAIEDAVGAALLKLSPTLIVKSVRTKTILAKAHLHRLICPYKICALAARHGLKAYWEPEFCNAIIVKHLSATIKIFPRTGSVIAFGRDLASMQIVYRQVCNLTNLSPTTSERSESPST